MRAICFQILKSLLQSSVADIDTKPTPEALSNAQAKLQSPLSSPVENSSSPNFLTQSPQNKNRNGTHDFTKSSGST